MRRARAASRSSGSGVSRVTSPSASPVLVRDAELDLGHVALVEPDEVAGEPGRRAEQDEQEPARERIERARVAGLEPEAPPKRANDGERRRADRLVDEHEPPSRSRSPARAGASLAAPTDRPALAEPTAGLHSQPFRACCRYSRRMNSTISSIELSLEKPAAWRCPPPPLCRAIADTSMSSAVVRRLTRRVGPSRGRRLADERDHVGSLDRPQVVDDALRERLLRARLREVLPQERRDDQAPAFVDHRPVERACEQLQLRERDVLVDALEHPLDVGAGLDELGGEPKRLRGRVRVLEPAGVRHDGDVEGLGDRRASASRRARRRDRAGSRPSTRRRRR